MIEKFDKCIKRYEKDTPLMSEYWNYNGIDDANGIIEQFNDEDWEKLIQLLPERSDIWKLRIINCLYDTEKKQNLRVLEALVDTDNIELFRTVLSALSQYDELSDETDKMIRERIENFTPRASKISSKIFDNYLKKNSKKDLKIFTHNT